MDESNTKPVVLKKSAFLFPIHEPKFHFGKQLVISINKYLPDYQIFIVFSSLEESAKFASLNTGLKFNPVIYPHSIDSGVINKKKFYGIQYIIDHTNFEYIACIDSEALVIKPANVDDRFEQYYKQRTIFASNTLDTELINEIITTAYRFFSPSEVKKLTTLLNNNRLYYWFNDIPIYKRDVFKRFADHINLKDQYETLTWFDFDFLIYSYYCLLNEGFSIKLITEKYLTYSFMESQSELSLYAFLKGVYKMKPNWIKQKTIFYPHAFMTFHNDRDNK